MFLAGSTALVPQWAFGSEEMGAWKHPYCEVAKLERDRVLSAADRYLKERPKTIISVPSPRSAGGVHDFYSEGDYWWPNPKEPNGPYIRRDGESNPTTLPRIANS